MNESFSKIRMSELLGKEEIPLRQDLASFPVPTNVGIELELENWQFGRGIDNSLWTEDTDGSLRNNGVELISKVLSGYRVSAALRDLTRNLDTQEPVANERTSFHLHLDVLDLTLLEFRNLVFIMGAYEPLLLQLCAEHRRCNSFALPLSHAPAVLKHLHRGMTEWSRHDWRHLISHDIFSLGEYKYGALNFASIGVHGTVEFRMHQGTFNITEIKDWIQTLITFKDWAKRYDNLDDLSVALEGDLLVEMHTKLATMHYDAISLQDAAQLVEEGIGNVDLFKTPVSDVHDVSFLEKFRLNTRRYNPLDEVREAVTPTPAVNPWEAVMASHVAHNPTLRSMHEEVQVAVAPWNPDDDFPVPTERVESMAARLAREHTERLNATPPTPEPTPAPERPTRGHPFSRFFGE
ncbi:putative amidoligase enzyme [Vibrio phage 1.208.B._10N.222.52.A7]|nr:putative amidoligase enzyme [Vibrio phage 1.208.B._10N.222.52.A7]